MKKKKMSIKNNMKDFVNNGMQKQIRIFISEIYKKYLNLKENIKNFLAKNRKIYKLNRFHNQVAYFKSILNITKY